MKFLEMFKENFAFMVEQYKKDGGNLPNRITEIRLLASVLVGVLLFFSVGNNYMQWVVFFLFIIVASTDKLDGYLARKLNKVTEFGKMIDPVVDKLLMLAVLILILFVYKEFWHLIILIVGCELIVGIISIFRRHSVDFLGKTRMFLQSVAIACLLLPVDGLVNFKMFFLVLALGVNIVSMISHIYRVFR